jgi:hypothetical protein
MKNALVRLTDHQSRQCFVGLASRDLEQVLPELFFGISLGQHVLRCVVHAAQVAGVHAVAAAPFARRGFQQQHRRARLAGREGRTQRGVAAADDQHIDHGPGRQGLNQA